MLVCISVGIVNEWMKPKYYYNEEWPNTNTFQDFYKLKKNTVDVLFMGNSHAVAAFNPQVIYDTYGITSYNLGSEQQSLLITYYWLREALKYQSPRAVVLETYSFHKYKDAYIYNALNCSEGAVRKGMDSMKLSPLKIEAMGAIERIDPTQIGLSYLLLNIRYHTRWYELGENDYTEIEMIDHGGIKGFSAMKDFSFEVKDSTIKNSDLNKAEAEPMAEIADIYLPQIIELCKKENIKLIFVKIPCLESIERYKTTKEFADKNDIPFYDLNEDTLYKKIEYDIEKYKYGHVNYRGAELISHFIGGLLLNDYDIPTREDKSFDQSRINYENRIKNIELAETTEINNYLEKLNDSRYSVFAFVPTYIGKFVDDDFMSRWKALGFEYDIRNPETGAHYCAVRSGGQSREIMTTEDIAFSGSIRNGLVQYSYLIDTKTLGTRGHKYSMVVDGTECGYKKFGIDIVVYDDDSKKIIDKVNINTAVKEKTITRY